MHMNCMRIAVVVVVVVLIKVLSLFFPGMVQLTTGAIIQETVDVLRTKLH